MYTIEVDFDVYKQLTVRRSTEEVSYNDVIRDLLDLGRPNTTPAAASGIPVSGDWVAKGVRFPAGTEFRTNYKGQIYTGRVEGGALLLGDGHRFESPSAAAVSIMKSAVNGWR